MTKQYTEEYREEAVRLALEGKQSRAQIARGLGVSAWTLREWVKKHEEKSGDERSPKVETFEEENRRLRRENDRLKMERDILKKAAAYFAKEQF
jgi:Transposase.